MLPRVKNVKHIQDYRLLLTFTDGAEKIFDMAPELWGEVFEPLKDIEYFKKVSVQSGTIRWPNGADFCPDVLYRKSQDVEVLRNSLKHRHRNENFLDRQFEILHQKMAYKMRELGAQAMTTHKRTWKIIVF